MPLRIISRSSTIASFPRPIYKTPTLDKRQSSLASLTYSFWKSLAAKSPAKPGACRVGAWAPHLLTPLLTVRFLHQTSRQVDSEYSSRLPRRSFLQSLFTTRYPYDPAILARHSKGRSDRNPITHRAAPSHDPTVDSLPPPCRATPFQWRPSPRTESRNWIVARGGVSSSPCHSSLGRPRP